jgi:hypothetical protein
MPAFYEYTVKVRIPNYMIAQGEELDAERLQHMLEDEFPEPMKDGDLKGIIVKAPDPEQIRQEQA